MKVAILTTFADFDRSYSLCGVVLEQAGMLIANGVDFDLFVNEVGPRLNDKSIDEHAWLADHIRKEVPTGKLEEDVINDEVCEKTEEWLRGIAEDYDVIITHDWMFTTWFVSYNQAVRNVAPDFPGTTWVHWVHSAPGGRPNRLVGAAALRYQTAPNSLYVYLNESDRLAYAESLGTDLSDVMTCYNPLDAASFFGGTTRLANFVRKHRLWDHDIMQVYPLSMPRADAKQLDALIVMFSEWKRLGYKVKLVVVNAHTTHENEKKVVEQYQFMAKTDHKLNSRELIFTSSEGEPWEYSVPYEDVQALLRLSNLFVFPSKSEACSRILQEASMAGCLVVGNESFPPMGEFLDPKVRQYTFGSLRWEVKHAISEPQWLREVAKSMLPMFDHPVMKQKQHMMRLAAWETIWREQFLPILERAKMMNEARKAVMT